jgi:hypothetical protein
MFHRKCLWVAPLSLTLACAQDSAGRVQASPPTAPTERASSSAPPARVADVASPEAILAATYEVISGPKGEPRDWDRFRSLFLPGARLIPTTRNSSGGGVSAHAYTPEEYIRRATPFFQKDGFFERGTWRRMERYRNIAQIFSTYESRHEANAEPFARGINSFQLFFDGTRWWVVTIFWQAETDDTPIPKEFLPGAF